MSFDPLSFGASAAGGIASNLWTDSRQKDAQKFNADQAALQMEFQEKMASTAWQRGVKDMKAAGINPILAYQRGPASSPTGAMASTSFTPASDFITPALSSARSSARTSAEIDNMRETNRNLQSQNNLLNAQIAQTGASTAKTVAETAVTTEMLKEAQRKGTLGEIDKKFYESTIGTIMRNLGLGLGEINPLTRAVPRPYIRVTPD